jgi:hypothetical protein
MKQLHKNKRKTGRGTCHAGMSHFQQSNLLQNLILNKKVARFGVEFERCLNFDSHETFRHLVFAVVTRLRQ